MQHQLEVNMSTTPKEALHLAPKIATVGDIVTVAMELTPENGLVLEPLFDTSGKVSFTLGEGNYLPGLHEIVAGMSVGDSVKGASIDGGYGKHNPELVIAVPKTNLKKMRDVESIDPGATLNLKGGIQVSVLRVTKDTIIVDANHPLAGSGYCCDLRILSIDRFPKSKVVYTDTETSACAADEASYEVASWAMGCFWGGELAFMRIPGVVGTKVGYTQGIKSNPTYEEVCQGDTNHREALMVTYDTRVVSYGELIEVYTDRLAKTANQYKMNIFDDDEADSLQYQHGIYYHNESQRESAKEAIAANNNKYNIEILQAAQFYDAEAYHQQYLLKGGQSARKGCKETIRCFG